MAEELSSSSSVQATKKISLMTGDGQLVEVDELVAMEFEILKLFFDENADALGDTVLLLPNVATEPLKYVIEFCKFHTDSCVKRTPKADVKAFDAKFVKSKSNDELKEMIEVANYLNIKKILDYLTGTAAKRIENKSVKYVRKFLGIENDYTPQEEGAAKNEYLWAFEGVDPDTDDEQEEAAKILN